MPLAAVFALHAVLLYGAMNAVTHPDTAPAVPREVVASLIPAQSTAMPQQPPEAAPPKPLFTPTPTPKRAVQPAATARKAQTPASEPLPQTTPAPATMDTLVDTPVPSLPAAPAPVSPEPQPPAAPAPPKTVSGVEYIQPPQPDYPPIAKRMGEEGRVMLRVLVSDRGRPEKVDVQKSSGFARLDEAARQAAMRAMFKPHLKDGRPVAVYALIPINFAIQ